MLQVENVILVDGSDHDVVDVVPYDDSEQFDEGDSDSSWLTDREQALNWSEWKHNSTVPAMEENRQMLSLLEMCAKCIACELPFEVVEQHKPPIPDNLQLRIAFWSFPSSVDEIRLYACLSSGSNEKLRTGHLLAANGSVSDVIQIGFHLSGVVTQAAKHIPTNQSYQVAVTFDRGRITSCQCSCAEQPAQWCAHATAVCIYRIMNSASISMRPPVSESLARLNRDQLQKFAQYLIASTLNTSNQQQVLPSAQRLLDELLLSKDSQINMLQGAPDPTAGASIADKAKWMFDETGLCNNIRIILGRFFGPTPLLYCDNYALLSATPTVSVQWSDYIRSFENRHPDGIWNLLEIVRHMSARGDSNAVYLLQCITEECLLCYQMIFYWLSSCKSLQCDKRAKSENMAMNATNENPKHASAHLMEEVVHLWELTVMSPGVTAQNKTHLKNKLMHWHKQIKESAKKGQGQKHGKGPMLKYNKEFAGFESALLACERDWLPYYCILGVTDDSGEVSKSTAHSSKEFLFDMTITRLLSIIPQGADEFNFVCKLAQALLFHGYNALSASLTRFCSGNLSNTYLSVDRHVTTTEKASTLCRLLQSSEAERAFEVALVGLTAFRQPSKTNKAEAKLLCLEVELYKRLCGMTLYDAHLELVRYRCEEVIKNPLSRGDAVLPLLFATFAFEALCRVHVKSSINKSEAVKHEGHSKDNDHILGYQCALLTLGVISAAGDQRHPMLCESIRHQRRDLAFALFTYSRLNEQQVEEVLYVMLNKERYGFLAHTSEVQQPTPSTQAQPIVIQRQPLPNTNNPTTKGDQANNKKSSTKTNMQDQTKLKKKQPPINFAQINEDIKRAMNNVCGSSDSDSGNGDNKPLPLLPVTRKPQPRRATRTKPTRSAVANQSKRTCGRVKKRTTRELTESDSGQEMHFSFEVIEARQSVQQQQPLSTSSSEPTSPEHPEGLPELQPQANIQPPSAGNLHPHGNIDLQPAAGDVDEAIETDLPQTIEIPQVHLPIIPPLDESHPEQAQEDWDGGFEDEFFIQADMFDQQPMSSTTHFTSSNVTSSAHVTSSEDNAVPNIESLPLSKSIELTNRLLKNMAVSDERIDQQPCSSTSVRKKELSSPVIDRSSSDSMFDEARPSKQSDSSGQDEVPKVAPPVDPSKGGAVQQKQQSGAKKEKKKKEKKKPGVDIQSIEAEAFSLFELAKNVLEHSHQRVEEQHPNKRLLQIAAFQIGLFALRIHNCSSSNWFSRTYSSYVTWIDNQVIETGSSALRLLLQHWQNALTPSEVTQVAIRAHSIPALKQLASELALSCLPFCRSLSHRDIQQTIVMCRKQSEQALEQACTSIENAGRHGELAPDLLFCVAREWHYLHEEKLKREGGQQEPHHQQAEEQRSEFITAEQFVQEQMHQQAQEMLGRQLHPRYPNQDHVSWVYPPYTGPLHHCPLPQQVVHARRIQTMDTYSVPLSPEDSEVARCLQNSYRVGMKALEVLPRRLPDTDKTLQSEIAPSLFEDIRWMCKLAAALGPAYLKNFCKVVYNVVSSPFLLHDLALESARHFASYNPAQLASHLRSPSVAPIVQKSLSEFTELIHHELTKLNRSLGNNADFVELLRRARSAFCTAPGGMQRFNEILETTRKTFPRKKELWQLIMNGLSKA